MPFLDGIKLLRNNPAFQRYPTNQAEWNGFIQEFDKFFTIKEQFVPTYSIGFSTDPVTPKVRWAKQGTIVTLTFSNTVRGTSDSNQFRINNLPENLQITSAAQHQCIISGLVDNGVESWGTAMISTNFISFGFEGASITSWTTSGSKGFETSSATNPSITYDTSITS